MAASLLNIVGTTLEGYSGVIADNVTNHNALLRELDRKGNKRPATGRNIYQEIEHAENGNAGWYTSHTSAWGTAVTETFGVAEFLYKYLGGNVVFTGMEEVENSGREAIHNLLSAKIRNLDKTLRNSVGSSLFGDGTSPANSIEGLAAVCGEDTTWASDTYGGINRSTGQETWWQNQIYDFSVAVVTPGADTIQTAMNTIWVSQVRGADRPDLGVGGSTYWTYYLESLQVNQRFTDDQGAGAGFTNVMYMGTCPVIFDSNCPAEKMYLLNTDYLFLRPSAERDFKVLPENSAIADDAITVPIVWAGNMTCSNPSLQGVIVA